MRLSLALVLFLGSSSALGVESALRLDGHVSLPLTSPQTSYFGLGGGGRVGFSVRPVSFFEVGASVRGVALPKQSDEVASGSGTLFVSLTLRGRAALSDAFALFLEGGGGWALTGGLNRPGAEGSLGAMFRLGASSVWLGPTAGVSFVARLSDEASFPTFDAVVLNAGLSLEFGFGEPPRTVGPDDRDGDGVADGDDACPDAAGAAELRGCPDGDADGVGDDVDRCPTQKGLADNAGCPAAEADADHDGVLLPADTCPAAPEDKDGFHDEDGCPDPDNDDDTVLDVSDACPLAAGPVSARGCPDSDGDGVGDAEDDCPRVVGTKATRGCPAYKQIVVTEAKIELRQKVFFAFGKANILPKSFELLDEVVQALKDRQRLCVRVEGHTDSVGSKEKNKQLSGERAASVRQYLVEHGIAPEALTSQGYGDEQPLESNASSEGRERNRRVEFVLTRCR